MTGVPGLSNAAAPGPSKAGSSAGAGSSADYDTFLQLLMAQLKTQDPTSPMDTSQFMQQLATFNQVEQTMTTNSKLDALLTSSALSQAESLIGRNVASADGTVSGEVAAVKITSDGPLATLRNGAALLLESGVTIS